jgi:CMP-N,N'-diacetyllegionaminic acid synthase
VRVLGIIPARGGSKGIPRKNLALIAGRPLIAYTIDAAKQATRLTELIVSTDDQEIADVARTLGVEVPFIRPAELAQDDTPTVAVVQHACKFLLEMNRHYDAICILQPTSPQRSEKLIDECVRKFRDSDADSLVTVVRVPQQYNPMWVYWKRGQDELELVTGGIEPIPRRQMLPSAFIRDGRVYLARTAAIQSQGSLYGG